MPKCMKCMEEYEQTDFCPYCGRKRDAASVYTDQIPEETILNRRFIIGDAVRKDRIGFLYIAWDALLEQKVYIREWFPVKTACRAQGQIQVKSEVSQDLWKRLEDVFLSHMEKLHKRQDISQLIPVYAFFRENNTVYSVMEYVNGMTLRELLSRQNPLSLPVAENIMAKLQDAVSGLLQNKIVHGNIPPDNIILCQNGEVKLLDPSWSGDALDDIKNTIFWSRYVPASYRKVPLQKSTETDKYSMAAVFYRMLTGEEPYGVLNENMKRKLPSMSEYGITVPKQTEKQIMKDLGENEKEEKGFLSFFHRK